jgi:hypothetical protein
MGIRVTGGPRGAGVPGQGAAESFWSTLKAEFYDRRRCATKADAKLAVAAGYKSATTGHGDTQPST